MKLQRTVKLAAVSMIGLWLGCSALAEAPSEERTEAAIGREGQALSSKMKSLPGAAAARNKDWDLAAGGAGGGTPCDGVFSGQVPQECDDCLVANCCAEVSGCADNGNCVDCVTSSMVMCDAAGQPASDALLACGHASCEIECFGEPPPVPVCDAPPQAPSMGACVIVGSPGFPCNPVTNAPCAAGEACDFGTNGYECYPPPNNVDLCMPCGGQLGDFCKGTMTCLPGGCARFCCDDGDCGTGVCNKEFPGAGSPLGVCVDPNGGAGGAMGAGGMGPGAGGMGPGAGGMGPGAGGMGPGAGGMGPGAGGAGGKEPGAGGAGGKDPGAGGLGATTGGMDATTGGMDSATTGGTSPTGGGKPSEESGCSIGTGGSTTSSGALWLGLGLLLLGRRRRAARSSQ